MSGLPVRAGARGDAADGRQVRAIAGYLGSRRGDDKFVRQPCDRWCGLTMQVATRSSGSAKRCAVSKKNKVTWRLVETEMEQKEDADFSDGQ